MTDKLSILTDNERAVLDTLTMKLNSPQALEYLKRNGIEISERTYFRCKKRIESLKWQRLYHIAELFTDQHLERIDKLQLVESLMWKNYDAEQSPFKKVEILSSIVNMQPYLSNYYGATRFVLEKRLKIDPIKKPPVYIDIDPDKKQVEENKFFSQRDYYNKRGLPHTDGNPQQGLSKEEQGDLRRMTLGKNLDRFNPEGDEEQFHKS